MGPQLIAKGVDSHLDAHFAINHFGDITGDPRTADPFQLGTESGIAGDHDGGEVHQIKHPQIGGNWHATWDSHDKDS